MKNIYLIPTDKPSRLFYNVGGALLFTNYENHNGVNIYITSDKEIKFEDYITDGYLVWKWKDDSSLLGRKKIILTTDQDLIKDGVQSIDDEFLEWFVKNPSCEEVELIKGFADGTDYGYNFLDYKIIIPKEEPNYNKKNEGQTAVEWLEKQLYSAKELDLAGVIEQAKEMEKQQKELEFDKGWSKGWDEAVKEYEKNH